MSERKLHIIRQEYPMAPPENLDLSSLNPAQQEAVNHKKGPLLVIAGAGSGKTKTLTFRVASLIQGGVDPRQILLLTFTRKAASNMLRRVEAMIGHSAQYVEGGTFHSLALKTLRKYHEAIGFPSVFSILDRSDAEDLISQIRQNYTKTDAKRFPKKNRILDLISRHHNTGKPLPVIIQESQWAPYESELLQIAQEYKTMKRQIAAMDYDDLLLFLRELLTQHRDVAEALQQQYPYILVDEYQDTNRVQSDILKAMASNTANIMAVGDDCQSIYSFRGAHYRNIMDFPLEFSNTHQVKLEENYRSTSAILALSNAVMEQAKESYHKTLFTNRASGEKPVYIDASSEHEQSRFICERILSLYEEGIPFREMAVLFRSSHHANDLELECAQLNIPYIKYGGIKFAEAAHIKDMISFLKVRENPQDILSWQRILSLLPGVGPKTVNDILRSLYTPQLDIDNLSKKFSKKAYWNDLKTLLFEQLQNPETNPSIVLEQFMDWYTPFFESQYDNYPKREADLQSLISISGRFEDATSFLGAFMLDPPASSQIDPQPRDEDEDTVTLSTIHSAKGLEWKVVFVISLVDGYLPSMKAIEGGPDQIDEERRLLYVAMTRAKDQLFLLKPMLERASYYSDFSAMSRCTRFLTPTLLENYTQRWMLSEELPEANEFGDLQHDEPEERRSSHRYML